MRNSVVKNQQRKIKRALRVRKTLRGSADKPRLCVVKTNRHIQAQLIDDEKGVTLAHISTESKLLRGTEFEKKNKASAKRLGELIAEMAKEKNIRELIFDRGPFKYHGILAELADAVRHAGLQF